MPEEFAQETVSQMTTGIRLAIRSSVERRRAAGAAAAQTRPGAAIAVRVDVRARRAVHDAGWRKMVVRLGVVAKLGFKAHPHMFRHACGFQLANQGTGARTLQAEGAYFARHLEGARRQGGLGMSPSIRYRDPARLSWASGRWEIHLCEVYVRRLGHARLAEQALARSKLSSQVSADLHQLRREWQTMLAPN
jgi:hypothetical protein